MIRDFSTIKIKNQRGVIYIKIDRPEAHNSINNVLIDEILEVVYAIEKDPAIKIIVLEGDENNFCTGMDFNAANKMDPLVSDDSDPSKYFDLLKHMVSCSKVVIARIDGKVNAGGIGIAAASDIVISNNKATYGLSECLFGLLPACVMPFLIRRIGVQKAQWLTLITQGIAATRAYEIGLVDEVSENTSDNLRKNLLRLSRLETKTILDLKNYVSQLWIIDEESKEIAVSKITSLVNSPEVKTNIKNFISHGKFPWEKC